jgi:hypothetical protein
MRRIHGRMADFLIVAGMILWMMLVIAVEWND